MGEQVAVPLHFAVEFLVLAVAIGAALDAVRRLREGEPGAAPSAMGFFALVAAQVAHGVLIVPEDGGGVLLGLRAAGFALIAVGIRSPRREEAPAFVVAGEGARLALAPALFAFIVAGRSFAALRRRRSTPAAAFAASFVAFGLAEGALALAPAGGSTLLVVSHALRAAAAILLARWLWAAVARSVRLRLLAAFVAALLLLVLVVSFALNQVIASNLEGEELGRLEIAGASRVEQLEARAVTAQDSAASIAEADAVRDRYISESVGSSETAKALLVGLTQGIDFLVFTGEDGAVLDSAGGAEGEPLDESVALQLAGSDVVVEALQLRQRVSGADSIGGRRVAVMGAAPVMAGGRPLGVTVLGIWVDATEVRTLAAETGTEVTLLIGGGVVATTLGAADAVNESFEPLAGAARTVRETGLPRNGVFGHAGERWLTALVPLDRPDGSTVAVLAFSRPAAVLASAQQSINRTLFLVALAGAAIAALLAWVLGGRVSGPIQSLTRAAEQLRSGDLSARAPVASQDEVGLLGASFNEMALSIDQMTGDLRSAAEQEAGLRARIEAIMQSMGDGLVATDAQGKIVAFNHAAELMVGRRADRAIGRALGAVVSGVADGRPLADAALNGTGSADAVLARADGSALAVALTSAPLRDTAGREAGRVVVFRNVTREREAERMKAELLANVSHELRTPITPIRGYAEILRRKQVPREQQERFLDVILESTARLERIVGILVDVAAIEGGRLTARSEVLDFGSLIGEAIEPMRAQAPRHTFERRVARGLPPVAGDARLLSRCLEELLDNAVKFSPEGGKVVVSASAVAAQGRRKPMVRLQVRDEGIGIEADQIPALFQDFRQGDGSETREFGGLGLGLSFVRRIAAVHHGDVTVESRAGRGSAFSVLLPAADIPGRGGARTARRPAASKKSPARPAKRAVGKKTTKKRTGTGRATKAAPKRAARPKEK